MLSVLVGDRPGEGAPAVVAHACDHDRVGVEPDREPAAGFEVRRFDRLVGDEA